ncbi:molecular chaperone [Pseudomonas sp. H9]|uniref:fimbrial biogenesis chaperone n=1 Tax=Pseudomonas sp. H9 TaxID=483968 RepID=UPI001057949E|nr:fimbria/pilus periplasmic chaperone [Pseudomonas sp. H9]TDF81591.1 molecular chaperone [Pseudomonas sp. H9]
MKKACLPSWYGWLLAACLFSGAANASIVIATTRVVYPAETEEVTVSLSNKGRQPFLVQAWIDEGQAEVPVAQLQVPFSLTPSLFRLDPGKGQTLRLFQTEHDFAPDRETLYWLNVLKIPPKGQGNTLQVAVRSRIKLLYRPAGLAGKAAQAPHALSWRLLRDEQVWMLEANNPSRYYVNLSELSVQVQGRRYEATSSHVAPMSTARFAVQGLDSTEATTVSVHFSSVNDYGAVLPGQQPAEVFHRH